MAVSRMGRLCALAILILHFTQVSATSIISDFPACPPRNWPEYIRNMPTNTLSTHIVFNSDASDKSVDNAWSRPAWWAEVFAIVEDETTVTHEEATSVNDFPLSLGKPGESNKELKRRAWVARKDVAAEHQATVTPTASPTQPESVQSFGATIIKWLSLPLRHLAFNLNFLNRKKNVTEHPKNASSLEVEPLWSPTPQDMIQRLLAQHTQRTKKDKMEP